MKNVLIISGSPRKKGNSQRLCEEFKKGAEDKGNSVELIRLAEKKIGFCKACDVCMKNNGTCVQQDDMAEVLDMAAFRRKRSLLYYFRRSGRRHSKTFIR